MRPRLSTASVASVFVHNEGDAICKKGCELCHKSSRNKKITERNVLFKAVIYAKTKGYNYQAEGPCETPQAARSSSYNPGSLCSLTYRQ